MSKVLKADQIVQQKKAKEIIYPDSDGKRMADNTEQFDFIVELKLNMEWIFAEDPNVFVAGDLLWYPVEGDNKIRLAPDTMVAFGRPKGRRGSYMQWKEAGIAPQVVFEVLSPGNRAKEMKKKLEFYEKYGVQEYYIIDPDRKALKGYIRAGHQLSQIVQMNGWTSPKLKIKFEIKNKEILLYQPNGEPFIKYLELTQRFQEKSLALDAEKARAENEKARAEKLAEQLRLLGIDPDKL